MFREDDDSFKRRLFNVIQMSWVFNTATTLVVFAVLFYLLKFNLVMGLLLGVLLAMLANLHLIMSAVTAAGRWEVYINRVVIPRGIRGTEWTIHYGDIESIRNRPSIAGGSIEITLVTGKKLRIDLKDQEKPLLALELAFREYQRTKADNGERGKIQIPIRPISEMGNARANGNG
jgi:hypothetical protein